MSMTPWVRAGCLVVLGLVVGCGGGGGDEPDEYDLITQGAYAANLDVSTDACGPEIHEVLGADVTQYDGNRIRIDVYIQESDECFAKTWTMHGTQTDPTTWDMDNVTGEYLCALDWDYGYQFFDMSSGTIEKDGAVYRLSCTLSAEHDTVVCAGWIWIYAAPR